jgi:hypothetical protein
MKRFATAIAISSVLLMSAAYADTHTWDRTSSPPNNNWSDGTNWDTNTVPDSCDNITIILPDGTTSIFDPSMTVGTFGVLTIGNNTSQVTLQVDKSDIVFGSCSMMGSWTHSGSHDIGISSTYCSGTGRLSLDAPSGTMTVDASRTTSTEELMINADDPNATRSFTKAGDGSLTVTEWTALYGDDDTGNYAATFTLNGGTFDPAVLYLYGGSTADRQARLVYSSGTLTTPDSTTIEDYVEVNVSDASDLHLSLGSTRCDTDATIEVLDGTDTDNDACQTGQFLVQHTTDTAITVHTTGEGVVRPSSLVLTGSTTYASIVTVDSGSGGFRTR